MWVHLKIQLVCDESDEARRVKGGCRSKLAIYGNGILLLLRNQQTISDNRRNSHFGYDATLETNRLSSRRIVPDPTMNRRIKCFQNGLEDLRLTLSICSRICDLDQHPQSVVY